MAHFPDLGKRCLLQPSTRPVPENLRTSCHKFRNGAAEGPSTATSPPQRAAKPFRGDKESSPNVARLPEGDVWCAPLSPGSPDLRTEFRT